MALTWGYVIVTTGWMLVEASGKRAGVLVHVLQHTGQSHHHKESSGQNVSSTEVEVTMV